MQEGAVPQPTEWQRIGDEVDAPMVFARTDFVNVCSCLILLLAFCLACPAIQHVREAARRDWQVARNHSMNDDGEQDRSRQYDAAKMLPDEFFHGRIQSKMPEQVQAHTSGKRAALHRPGFHLSFTLRASS
jgi:hypothetical protein